MYNENKKVESFSPFYSTELKEKWREESIWILLEDSTQLEFHHALSDYSFQSRNVPTFMLYMHQQAKGIIYIEVNIYACIDVCKSVRKHVCKLFINIRKLKCGIYRYTSLKGAKKKKERIDIIFTKNESVNHNYLQEEKK